MATDVSLILMRIQEKFNVKAITPQNIADWLDSDRRGMSMGRRRLATQLSKIVQEENKIALSISLTQSFAKQKGIRLSEKIIGREENWKGRKVLTIREKGKFKSWRLL